MSTLYLIRHGQASFLAENYDQLSDRGRQQAARLGAHIATAVGGLDALYCGPRQRHVDTARHMMEAAAEQRRPLPAPQRLEGLDEFPLDAILAAARPDLTNAGAAAAAEAEGTTAIADAIDDAVVRWSHGEIDLGAEAESYASFRGRVIASLEHIMREQGRGKTVAAVTSGGPVSISVRHALRLAPDVGWQVAWVTRNASFSEFRYRPGRFSLVSFNEVPHLTADQITFV